MTRDGRRRPLARRLFKNFLRYALRLTTFGFSKGWHLSRFRMYQRMEELGKDLPSPGEVLSVSNSMRLCRVLGFDDDAVKDTSYPDVDILDLPYPDESFDYVVSDCVLEHVAGAPRSVMEECRRVLRPGGHAIHTTRLLYPIHGPSDFWGFTPDALAMLCDDFSTVVEAGGWGNLMAMFLIGLRLHRLSVPHARWHPVHWLATAENPRCPIQTWVVARK